MKPCRFDCIFIIAISLSGFSTEDLVVTTSLGLVVGRHIKSYEGRTVTAFEGIPYAKPPVGDLRFREPQPVDPWLDLLVANKTYVCLQYTAVVPRKATRGQEDCLYLYVYVPRETINGNENLDVVVRIHGGAFMLGDPKSNAGSRYVMDRDLVYVSMKYRLGILGFLSTEDEVVPGNNGLKDQVLALKWIKENIVHFGGNPNSITLTGGSAGGASVHFHYLSPLSKGLFHRGLSQSATAVNPWVLTANPAENTKKLAALSNCNMESWEAIIGCLKDVPGETLVLSMSNFFVYTNGLPSNPFAPIVELDVPGAFLPDHPYKLLTEGRFHDCPWIVSNTQDEGIIPVGFIVLFRKLHDFDQRWYELLPYTLNYFDTAEDDAKILVSKKVKEEYLNNAPLAMDNIADLIKLHTDRLYLVDTEKAIRLQVKGGKSPVYYYYFDYFIHMSTIYKANLHVVGHGDDCRLLFYQQDNPAVLSEADHSMKEVFLDFLYNYAKNGTPTFKNLEWKPVSSNGTEIEYMHVSSAEDIYSTTRKDIGRSSFWNSLPFNENEKLFYN